MKVSHSRYIYRKHRIKNQSKNQNDLLTCGFPALSKVQLTSKVQWPQCSRSTWSRGNDPTPGWGHNEWMIVKSCFLLSCKFVELSLCTTTVKKFETLVLSGVTLRSLKLIINKRSDKKVFLNQRPYTSNKRENVSNKMINSSQIAYEHL